MYEIHQEMRMNPRVHVVKEESIACFRIESIVSTDRGDTKT